MKDNQQQLTAYMSFPQLEHRCIKSMKMPKPLENTAGVTEQPLKELLELTHTRAKTQEEFYWIPCFLPIFPALSSSALLTARENHSGRRTNTFQHNQIQELSLTHLPWKVNSSLSGCSLVYPSQPLSFWTQEESLCLDLDVQHKNSQAYF